nr:putative ribonuclease H-like domain-containing protein [Tanacetum cinerariifolium]
NVAGSGPAWLFDIDSLSQTMNYHPVFTENQTNSNAGFQDLEKAGAGGTQTYVLFSVLSDGSKNPKNNKDAHTGGNKHNNDIQKPVSPDIHSSSCGDQAREQGDKDVNKDKGVRDQGGISQMFNEDFHTCMFACFLSQEEPKRIHQALKDPSWIKAMQEELLQFKMQKVWILVDLPYGKRAIGTKWVYRNKKDERGIVIRN